MQILIIFSNGRANPGIRTANWIQVFYHRHSCKTGLIIKIVKFEVFALKESDVLDKAKNNIAISTNGKRVYLTIRKLQNGVF